MASTNNAPAPFDEAAFQSELKDAVDLFDQLRATALCKEIVQTSTYSEKFGAWVLGTLRRKRYFSLMENVAPCFVQSSQIRRQLAQALIDQGKFDAALATLDDILTTEEPGPGEWGEAKGLVGRAFKQTYVNASNLEPRMRQPLLEKAIAAYWEGYQKTSDSWHSINVVALVARARRDRLVLENYGGPATEDLAKEVLNNIEAQAAPDLWAMATAAEAELFFENYPKTAGWLRQYVQQQGADAFELTSTIRQFTEVWGLSDDEEPGKSLLAVLNANLLKCKGGAVEMRPSDGQSSQGSVSSDGAVTMQWWQLGLERCKAVGRVDTKGDRGTGFLVKGSDINPVLFGDERLLITNAHVIEGQDLSLAKVWFQATGEPYDVEECLWQSSSFGLDAALLRLKGLPADAPFCPLSQRVLAADGSQSVYIIGHPLGGELKFSTQNNLLVYRDQYVLHYRTSTQPGNSGSPVFDDEWNVVAVHHLGDAIPRTSPPYHANEGISMRMVAAARGIQEQGTVQPFPKRNVAGE